MKIKILFWNINKSNNIGLIKDLVKQENADIILLAEAQNMDVKLLEKDLQIINKEYKSRFISQQKIMILDKFKNYKIIADSDKRTSSGLYTINGKKILVVGIHLRAKYGNQNDDLYDLAGQYKEYIENHSIENTVIIGDFNMNPYEKGIMGVTGFNAIMSSDIIKYNHLRKYGNKNYILYYNPSWEAYALPFPNGSFYYGSNSTGMNPYWHLLDQVLLSPSILINNNYVNNSFKIITKINSNYLLRSKKNSKKTAEISIPDDKNISDHLPILFEMSF